MKIFFLIIGLLLFSNAKSDDLEDNIKRMANELEAKYPGTIKVRVAILQFRTSSNELTRFNQYLQDQLFSIYLNSKRFEVIDQVTVNRLIEASNWNLDVSSSFEKYNELSEQIFRNLGLVPDAFIYGLIDEQPDWVTITSYILPNGIKSNNINSTVKFHSSDLTSQLLGKSLRVQSLNQYKGQLLFTYPTCTFITRYLEGILISLRKEDEIFIPYLLA